MMSLRALARQSPAGRTNTGNDGHSAPRDRRASLAKTSFWMGTN
jgi:hypothetical protein